MVLSFLSKMSSDLVSAPTMEGAFQFRVLYLEDALSNTQLGSTISGYFQLLFIAEWVWPVVNSLINNSCSERVLFHMDNYSQTTETYQHDSVVSPRQWLIHHVQQVFTCNISACTSNCLFLFCIGVVGCVCRLAPRQHWIIDVKESVYSWK